MEFDNAYSYLYPSFDKANIPELYIDNPEITLTNCELGEGVSVSVTVRNRGKEDLIIKNVDVGCNCVELLTEKLPVISPGTSGELGFMFTPDVDGEVIREILILSNARNKIETLTFKAITKQSTANP